MWRELANNVYKINLKIYKILNFGLVVLLAIKIKMESGKYSKYQFIFLVYMWSKTIYLLTNYMSKKQMLLICLINVGKAADASYRIPHPLSEKQNCLKTALSLLFFLPQGYHCTSEFKNIGNRNVPGFYETN